MAVALGVAWSEAAAALVDLGHLVDLVEVPGWALAEVAGHPIRRVVVHNLDKDASLSAADHVDDSWIARARDIVTASRSPWLSLHLGFSTERVRFDGHMLPESDVLDREALRDHIIANVRRARASLNLPLLLENLDYCPEGAYEFVCEPGFISEILEATGCEMLLDIAHLRVTASWFGVEPEQMLSELPLHRVLEVHISSPRPLENGSGRLDDVHDRLTERDLELLNVVLERSNPAALVLEYRRESQALREQLVQLAQVIGRAWRGVGC